uniref:Uncharacterized protein n=1 Tax=Manihot esculenta TaxID=3983 RepID=A0A2C9VEP0_MANES
MAGLFHSIDIKMKAGRPYMWSEGCILKARREQKYNQKYINDLVILMIANQL